MSVLPVTWLALHLFGGSSESADSVYARRFGARLWQQNQMMYGQDIHTQSNSQAQTNKPPNNIATLVPLVRPLRCAFPKLLLENVEVKAIPRSHGHLGMR